MDISFILPKAAPPAPMNAYNRIKELTSLYVEYHKKYIETQILFKLIDFVEKEEILSKSESEEFIIAQRYHEFLIKHKSCHLFLGK